MTWKQAIYPFYYSFLDFFQKQYTYRSAALSFYVVMAVIPLVMVVTTILSYLPFDPPQVTDVLNRTVPNLPSQAGTLLHHLGELFMKRRGWIAGIGFLFAYYFAARLFLALYRTFSIVFEKKATLRSGILIALVAVPIIVLALLLINVFSFGLTTIIQAMMSVSFLVTFLPEAMLNLMIKVTLWVNFATFMIFSFLVYHFLVPRSGRLFWGSLWVSLVMSTGFLILKGIFGSLIIVIAKINPVYGLFSGAFGILLWIYWAFILILFGARALYYIESGID